MTEVRPIVLLDYDRTIFDADRFFADAQQVLEHRYGLRTGQLTDEYIEYCQWQNGIRYYDLFRHIAAHTIDDHGAELVLARELSKNNYVYPDVLPFIEALQPLVERIAYLTHGTERYQQFKRRMAPRLPGLPFYVTLLPKGQFITEQCGVTQGIIVDDKPIPNLPGNFVQAWLGRPGQATAAAGRAPYHSLQAVLQAWPELTEKLAAHQA